MTEHAVDGGWSTGRVMTVILMALCLGAIAGFGARELVARRQTTDQREATARGAVDAIMLRYHWEKWETDPANKTFLGDLSRGLENQRYSWDFIMPQASEKGTQPQDEFQHTALETFKDPAAPRESKVLSMDRIVTKSGGKRFYEYLQPVYVKKNCIHCHNTQAGPVSDTITGVNEGDLMAVVKVVFEVER